MRIATDYVVKGILKMLQEEAMAGDKTTSRVVAGRPVRLKQQTLDALSKLKRKANTDVTTQRIRTDDLVCLGLGLIEDQHLEVLREAKRTNKDRFEVLFKRFQGKNKKATRDDFLGMLLVKSEVAK